jgi:hypothetical protein
LNGATSGKPGRPEAVDDGLPVAFEAILGTLIPIVIFLILWKFRAALSGLIHRIL